jgi:hypothetical protein
MNKHYVAFALSLAAFSFDASASQAVRPADDTGSYAEAPTGGATLTRTPSRFALMWLGNDGTPHRAAIRGDGSIRSTDDPGLTVTIFADGEYCIHATSAAEGAVGVAQNDGGDVPRTIDVSMGIGSDCNEVPDSNITVQTWIQ